jgi:hypothetical protein
MRRAADAKQFERAATIRDTWRDLNWLRTQLQHLEDARRDYSFVYPMPGYGVGETWCLIRRGHVVAAAPAPDNTNAAEKCAHLIQQAFLVEGFSSSTDDLDAVHVTTSWFRSQGEERGRTLAPGTALQLCSRIGDNATA